MSRKGIGPGLLAVLVLLAASFFSGFPAGLHLGFGSATNRPVALKPSPSPTRAGPAISPLLHAQLYVEAPTPSPPPPPPAPRPPAPAPPPPAPPANCSVPAGIANDLPQLSAAILHAFGLRLGGDALTVSRAQLTYETMCLAFRSTAYQQNLNSLRYPVIVNFINKGKCFAYAYASPPHIDMWEPCSVIIDKYVLIHELTHQMQFGSALGRNAHWAQWQAVWVLEKNHRIPTGPCVFEDPGDGGECEADAVAEYMFYRVYRNAWTSGPPGGPTLSNYPTEWPRWYNFAKTYIFGGVTY